MITVDVQQVTTRSKTAQSSQWDTQDSVQQQATEWVEAANNRNIDRMKTDTATFPQHQSEPPHLISANSPNTTNPTKTDEVWHALADSQISMPLHKLLHLLPWFKENIHSPTARDTAQPAVHLTAPATGPPLMDSQNPSVQILIHGQQVSGYIIDGGSDMNVISDATCSKLDITEWVSCPFLLRMADTRSVRPIGLIWNLEFTLGGHAFTVSVVYGSTHLARSLSYSADHGYVPPTLSNIGKRI